MSAPAVAAAGLFGKLPARGDFVRLGLPRGFVQPWDDWLQQVIAGSRARLGERWLPAWLEAPIWHFALPAGMCGEGAVLGVWLPSVDRAGRHFPLTLALVLPPGADPGLSAPTWLARAETAGLQALSDELPPEAVAALLEPRIGDPAGELPDLAPLSQGQALWWTEGSPFVPPATLVLADLPDAAGFTMMLDATSAAPADGDDPAADAQDHPGVEAG